MSTTPVNDPEIGLRPPTKEHATWDADVLGRLRAHVESERDVLAEYADAMSTIEEDDVRYLMGMIVEDEARHHRIFEELVHALEGVRTWHKVEPSVPERATQPLREDVRRATERFLEAEHEDRRQLKALRRTLDPVAETTLWALLVDLMALDTEKHIRILETIAGRTGR